MGSYRGPLLILFLGGLINRCSTADTPQSLPLRIELPQSYEYASIVVRIEGQHLTTHAPQTEFHARDVTSDGDMLPIFPSIDVHQDFHVTVFTYDQTLADLALAPGLLAEASDGPGREIPASAQTLVYHSNGGTGSWHGASPSLETDIRFRTALVKPCAKWSMVPQELGVSQSHKVGAAAATHDGALIAAFWNERSLDSPRSQELFYIYRDNQAITLDIVGATPVMLSAFAAADGTFRIGDFSGGIWEASLTPPGCLPDKNPCRALETKRGPLIPSDIQLRWLTGPQDLAAGPFYGFGIRGAIEKYDGTDWEHLHAITRSPIPAHAGIAYVGPEEIVAVTENNREVFRARGKKRVFEPIPQEAKAKLEGDARGLTSVAHSSVYGTVVGDDLGGLYVYRRKQWQLLRSPTLPHTGIRAIAPYERGFLTINALGQLQEFIPTVGFCPLELPGHGTIDRPHKLIVAGDNVYTIVHRPTHGPVIRWFKRAN